MADDPGELPRGVAVIRQRGAPPWGVDAGPSLHVVVRGSFHLLEEERRVLDLEAGDLVLIGLAGAGHPGTRRLQCVNPPTEIGNDHGEPAEMLSATYATYAAHAAHATPDRGPGAVLRLSAGDVQRERGLAALVGLLRAALVDGSEAQERLARSLLDPLLAYALHGHARAQAGDPATRPALAVDPRVCRALQQMRESPARPWTVAALARAAGLSRAAFARRFLAELGMPPLRFLAELRMDLGARLLAEGDASLAFIAARVGYESEFAFSRAFKRRTGEAPGAYRRRRRAELATLGRTTLRAVA